MISHVWLLLCFASSALTANAMLMHNNGRSSSRRYFTQDGMLPPLLSLSAGPSNQTTTIPYSESEGRSIPVVYTNDPSSVYTWLSNNLPYEGCTIGFDVEARPSFFRKKDRSSFDDASTVQLATPDSCLVVHLVRGCSGRHSQACAPVLKAVLCDEQYVKAGCALDDDMMALYEVWGGLKAKSRLDLGFIGSRTSGQKNNNNKRRSGLKTLSRAVIGVDLPKPKKISMSDWSSVPLTEKQIIYSARDAWAGAAIVNKLAEYDSDTFGNEALVRSLQHSETPISKLVDRQRRRDRAKRDLGKLLKPYKASPRRLPEPLFRKVQCLREVIKERVIDPNLVFEIDNLDLKI